MRSVPKMRNSNRDVAESAAPNHSRISTWQCDTNPRPRPTCASEISELFRSAVHQSVGLAANTYAAMHVRNCDPTAAANYALLLLRDNLLLIASDR